MFNSNCFIEQKYYSLNKYNNLFSDSKTLNQLLKFNLIEFNGNQFKFEFVGVIIIGDAVLYCYPKYIENKNNCYDKFKQILKVIKKFNKREKTLLFQNDEYPDFSKSLLSLMLFFIEDYYENDVYRKTHEIIEVNGNGEIDWNMTINYTYPIIQNGKPYYTELKTRHNLNDLANYFRLLHECIITECSKYLESKKLLDLFDLTSVNLSVKSLYDFGSDEFIKEQLENELKIEFNTHNRIILNAMLSFIDEFNSTKNLPLTLYGTNEYWAVWEKMCSEVLENNLEDKIGDIFGINLNQKYLKNKKLKNIIGNPILHLDGEVKKLSRLKPDLVIINEKEKQLVILDAKYRNLNLNTIEKHLELYDINKQYLYQLAYNELIESENIKDIKNALLFPTDGEKVTNRGFIKFKMFSNIKLHNVQLIDVPAYEMNKCFLEGRSKSISWLKLNEDDFEFK